MAKYEDMKTVIDCRLMGNRDRRAIDHLDRRRVAKRRRRRIAAFLLGLWR